MKAYFVKVSLLLSSPAVWAGVRDQVGRLVTAAHKAERIRLPAVALVRESTVLYNEMVDRLDDPSDIDELRALIPWAKARLTKRLRDAVANPGTGKRSA
ncbi:MAG: hypothetical protein ACTSP2_10685 [Alphaproteobacteria bacterium]